MWVYFWYWLLYRVQKAIRKERSYFLVVQWSVIISNEQTEKKNLPLSFIQIKFLSTSGAWKKLWHHPKQRQSFCPLSPFFFLYFTYSYSPLEEALMAFQAKAVFLPSLLFCFLYLFLLTSRTWSFTQVLKAHSLFHPMHHVSLSYFLSANTCITL